MTRKLFRMGYEPCKGDCYHQLQAIVLSQAAARAYPDRFRLLGQKGKQDAQDRRHR